LPFESQVTLLAVNEKKKKEFKEKVYVYFLPNLLPRFGRIGAFWVGSKIVKGTYLVGTFIGCNLLIIPLCGYAGRSIATEV
jgi:hypothetical protein